MSVLDVTVADMTPIEVHSGEKENEGPTAAKVENYAFNPCAIYLLSIAYLITLADEP